MARFFCLLLVCLAAAPAAMSMADNLPGGAPTPETPVDLVRAWLRFHESELCQGFDASFVFTKDGVEVRSVVEDEKAYQKFGELFEPLRTAYRVEMHAERPRPEEDPDKDRDPPPSLWENYELRAFLGDPLARARERADFEEKPLLNAPPPPDEFLKRRLFIYSERTIEWSRKVERYARDLPALTRLALDPHAEPDLRSRARTVCLAHAGNMDRYIGKLNGNLSPAFPRSSRKGGPPRPESPGAARSAFDQAVQITVFAQALARRVYQFIHPEHFTVGLDELRKPGLLDSLKILQKMDSDFRKSLSHTK